jgi:hypothetical protein
LPAACMLVAAFTAVVDPMAVAATAKVALSRRGSQLKTASPFFVSE